MEANDASRIIAVVDRRIEKKTGAEATTETTWGEVCAISADGKYASAYLYGEAEFASEGFRIPGDLALNLGDKVKVAWNGRGERWVYDVGIPSAYKKVTVNPNTGQILVGDGTVPPATPVSLSGHNHDTAYASLGHSSHTRVRATATDGVSLASTLHGLQVGPDSGPNIAVDSDEVMARNNGAAADLHLNADGGLVTVGNNSPASGSGLRVMKGGVRLGTGNAPSNDFAILFGADVELRRSAANVLQLDPTDIFDGNTILASAWDNLATGASYSLTAATEQELTGVAPSLVTPAAGNFRIWFMGSLRWSHSVAAELEGWVRLRSGGTGGTALDIPNLQTFQMGAGEEASFACLGWIDSASAGTSRAIAGLTNGLTVTADWSIRASVAGTATVYAAAVNYVTNLHMWVTRLP